MLCCVINSFLLLFDGLTRDYLLIWSLIKVKF